MTVKKGDFWRFWNAYGTSSTAESSKQRCWVHKTPNVVDAFKRLHPDAKKIIC